MKIRRTIGLCAMLTSAGFVQAQVTGYTSDAAYSAAVGAQLYVIDFNSQIQASFDNGIFPGQVDFGSPEATDPSKVLFSGNAMTDAGSTVAGNSVGPIGGVFASPVFAFSLIFSSSANAQTIYAYDSASALIGSAVSNPAGFFGLVSNTPISSFLIDNGLFVTGNPDRFFVDDFAVNAPIPEPETYAMLLAGLGLLGWHARRRKLKPAG